MFSQLAVVLYSIVYIPQFILIWKNKSSNGVSLTTILLWTQADFIGLAASIFLQLNPTIIFIDWYHCITSMIMSIFCLYFSERRHNQMIAIYFLYFANFIFCLSCQTLGVANKFAGELLAWTTSIIYVCGRFPQIYKNWRSHSTKGLSITMYILTMLGNGFYLISIFEQNDISLYTPWILLISFSILLDTVILIQWHLYFYQVNPDSVRVENLECDEDLYRDPDDIYQNTDGYEMFVLGSSDSDTETDTL